MINFVLLFVSPWLFNFKEFIPFYYVLFVYFLCVNVQLMLLVLMGFGMLEVHIFQYQNTWITLDEICITEIKNKIWQEKTAFYKIKNILCNKSLSMEVRKRILACVNMRKSLAVFWPKNLMISWHLWFGIERIWLNRINNRDFWWISQRLSSQIQNWTNMASDDLLLLSIVTIYHSVLSKIIVRVASEASVNQTKLCIVP